MYTALVRQCHWPTECAVEGCVLPVALSAGMPMAVSYPVDRKDPNLELVASLC